MKLRRLFQRTRRRSWWWSATTPKAPQNQPARIGRDGKRMTTLDGRPIRSARRRG